MPTPESAPSASLTSADLNTSLICVLGGRLRRPNEQVGQVPRSGVSRCRMPGKQVQLPQGKLLMRRPELESPLAGVFPVQVYSTIDDDLRVIVGMEPYLRDEVPRLHVSFSHPDRLPDWEMIKKVKQAFFGDEVEAVVWLPKARHYVNRHPYTHHLWETPDDWISDGDQ